MNANWRPLRPGEIDHEVLWLSVSVAAALGACAWLKLGMPLPHCVFHTVTGQPCPACGATRCVRFLLAGDFGAAFRMNPLAFLAFGGVALYDAYAATVLALRLPRFRPRPVLPRTGNFIRIAVVTMIVVNWAWLIWSGV
jgi:hypothetical protein